MGYLIGDVVVNVVMRRLLEANVCFQVKVDLVDVLQENCPQPVILRIMGEKPDCTMFGLI